MYFWLNYVDKGNIERIPIAVKNIGHLFYMASEVTEADTLHLFLLSDGTRIDEDEYLGSLEDGTKSIYFELNRYLSHINMSHPLIILYDAWLLSGWLLFSK